MLPLWNIHYPPAYPNEQHSPFRAFIEPGRVASALGKLAYIGSQRTHQYAAIDGGDVESLSDFHITSRRSIRPALRDLSIAGLRG
jgi:hypothetical protein